MYYLDFQLGILEILQYIDRKKGLQKNDPFIASIFGFRFPDFKCIKAPFIVLKLRASLHNDVSCCCGPLLLGMFLMYSSQEQTPVSDTTEFLQLTRVFGLLTIELFIGNSLVSRGELGYDGFSVSDETASIT